MSAPKPEVVYLPAIFRSIRAGEMRAPAFQRGFVWKPSQIIDLLESVYKSYPIGSLLLWHVDQEVMRTDMSGSVPFPHPTFSGPVDFVLDGMQRVSTLFGAFHAPSTPSSTDKFATVFELETQTFLPYRDRTETSVDLRRLFSPRLLLDEQARLSELANGEVLVERTLELQRRFQEYLVPIVRIGNRLPEQVVEIFERVNNTGTKLSAVDFMRALTWSDAFDLTEALATLKESIDHSGIKIPSDTLAKCIALQMDIMPTSDEMVKLRKLGAGELSEASRATKQSLSFSIDFLLQDIGIRSYDYVGYEGQLLVIASAVGALGGRPAPSWLARWFWTVGFSESFQGRTDHAIARLALQAKGDPFQEVHEAFTLTLDALSTRVMSKRAALPMTFVAALATAPAHSVITGEQIDLTEKYDSSMAAVVFGHDALRAAQLRLRTDKVVANVVLLAYSERRLRLSPSDIRSAILRLAEIPNGIPALATQCIDGACLQAIASNDPSEFLVARARAIHKRASKLCSAN